MNKFLALLLLANGVIVSAQQHSLIGSIKNSSTNEPVEFVNVLLYQNNSIPILGTISDNSGKFSLSIKEGDYILRLEQFGEVFLSKNIHIFSDMDLGQLSIQPSIKLQEIVVDAKSIIEQKVDRLRFNVPHTDLFAKDNSWETLQKTPLVQVNSEGKIQISGLSNTIIYINDKRKPLSGNALKSYLSSIPSSNLEAIEVITTPSSKYEVEGNTGIINIIVKKNENDGLTGNVALSTRQTQLNSLVGNSYLNYRNEKWNLYSTLYKGSKRRMPEFHREIHYNNNSTLLQRNIDAYNKNEMFYSGANLGVDYQINDNHIVGVIFDYYDENRIDSGNAHSYDRFKNKEILSLTKNKSNLNSDTYSLNLNYEGNLDTKGKKLSLNYDMTNYSSSNELHSITHINQKMPILKSWFKNSAPQKVNNYSTRVDYEQPINATTSFETGVKFSHSKIENNIVFENTQDGENWELDTLKNNYFKYDEDILAFYFSLQNKFNDQWSTQAGIRLENTMAKGWLDNQLRVDRNYINILPTLYLKYTTKKDKNFALAVSGRITRPSYWDVNPFRTYTTDEAYFEGNPFLNPSKYYREELKHSFRNKLGTFIFQLVASQTLDEFYALPYNPSANLIVNRKVNYGNKYGFGQTTSYYGQIIDG